MPIQKINRRTLLKSAGAAIAAPAFLQGNAFAAGSTFKIGIVTPLTGPLAGFGEAHDWILAGIKDALAGVQNNGQPVKIEIITKDSQSNPNRAQKWRVN